MSFRGLGQGRGRRNEDGEVKKSSWRLLREAESLLQVKEATEEPRHLSMCPKTTATAAHSGPSPLPPSARGARGSLLPAWGATPFDPLTLSGFPPRLPLALREPDNKGGSVLGAGGAAWALTQRRVRPRPAPGPAAPLRRGRAGSERAAAAFPPAPCPSSCPPGVPLSSCRCLFPAARG